MPRMHVFAKLLATLVVTGLFIPQSQCRTAEQSSTRAVDWTLRDGHLHVDGSRVFLKTAKPLRNFADAEACRRLEGELETLQAKGFNAV